MPTQSLPRDPSLENLKKQAKTLHKKVSDGDNASLQLALEFCRDFLMRGKFSLTDAQLVIARQYGFASWAKLKERVEVVERYSRSPHVEPAEAPEGFAGQVDAFLRLACLTYGKDHSSRADKARVMLKENAELGRANIYAACAVGDAKLVKAMLAREPGLAKTVGGAQRWEPLLYACYSRVGIEGADWVEVAKLLLAHGADPNSGYLWEGTYGFTALTGVFGEGEAGKGNQPEHPQCMALARLLLEAGADANDAQVLYNRHFEAGNEHLELLLEFGLGKGDGGPWKERMGPTSQTPAELVHEQVCLAAIHGRLERVKLLVEHGGEFKTADKGGRTKGLTPLAVAIKGGNRGVAEYLISKGASAPGLSELELFCGACLAGDEAQARGMLAKDPGLLEKLGHGRGVLMERAAGFNKLEGVKLMAKLGFEVNWPGKASPLHSAAWAGHVEMAKLLVSVGADLEARDPSYNARPVDWAKYNHQAEMVAYLEGMGKKPD
jgi:hypothetical protein